MGISLQNHIPILFFYIWRSTKEFSRGYWTCNFCCWPGHPVIYCNLGHFPGLKISILLLSFRTYIKVIFPKYWKHQLFSCESVASLFHRDNPSADPYKYGGQCFLLLRWCLHVKRSTPNVTQKNSRYLGVPCMYLLLWLCVLLCKY